MQVGLEFFPGLDGVEDGGEEWGKGWCYVVVGGEQTVAGDAWGWGLVGGWRWLRTASELGCR